MKVKFFNNKVKIKPLLTDYFFHFKDFRNNPYKITGSAVLSSQPVNPLDYYKTFDILDKGIVECSRNEAMKTMPLFQFEFKPEKMKEGEPKQVAKHLFTAEFPQNFRLKWVMDNYIQNPNRQNFIMSKPLCSALLKAPQAPNLSILPFKVGGDYFMEFPNIQVGNISNVVGAMIKIFPDNGLYGFVAAYFFKTNNGDLDFRTLQWQITEDTLNSIKGTEYDSLDGWHRCMFEEFRFRHYSWWEKIFKKEEYEYFKHVKQVYQKFGQDTKEMISDPMFQFLFNSLLFIHNADALSFEKNLFKKESEKLKQNGTLESVCVLGEDFKNIRYSSSTHTEVSSHFRWQPYGSKMDKYKLIKIESYTKKNTIPLFDEETLEDTKQPFRQWEKEARAIFDETLLPLAKMNDFKVQTEFRVNLETLHKIDYIMVNNKYVIAIEYKSDKAKWNQDKIEIQRRFYHRNLCQMYPNHEVHTFLVSDTGKYGLSHDEFVQEISKIIEDGIIVPDFSQKAIN